MERRSGRNDTFVLKRPKSGSKQILVGVEVRYIECLTIGLASSSINSSPLLCRIFWRVAARSIMKISKVIHVF